MVTTMDRPSIVPTTGEACIYIRVSSHKQEDGASLDVQQEACRKYCQSAGLSIVSELQDVGSGLDIDRVSYQEALRLARAREITHLVVFRYDRVGRDDAEYYGMLKDFTRTGITLVSASGEAPDLFSQKLMGLLAWNESQRLSIRVTGSKMKRHETGNWTGKPPFGYSIAKHPNGGSYLIPSGEAELVREMFTRYASGKHSLYNLRDYLNSAGVLKSRHAIWYALRNRLYLGEVPRGKNITSQFHEAPELSWSKGLHDALVDPETFERVQVRLSANKSRQSGGPAPKYLFSGMVFCGGCGRRYAGRRTNKGRGGDRMWTWYACNRKVSFGDCESHTVYESRIRAEVIPPIEHLLAQLQQEDLRAVVRAKLVQQEQETRAADQGARTGAADELKRLEHRLSQWEDMAADGEMPRERFVQRRDEILPRIRELQQQLQERPHLALPDVDQLFELADALAGEPPDEPEWRGIIAGVVERIIIDGREIRVGWQDWFQPLLDLA